ncbi:hypothetical protein KKD88_00485, partial [Patescibacteria group bacterium]|nr:hypothetical protein [Patescibacteria group bacterium]
GLVLSFVGGVGLFLLKLFHSMSPDAKDILRGFSISAVAIGPFMILFALLYARRVDHRDD